MCTKHQQAVFDKSTCWIPSVKEDYHTIDEETRLPASIAPRATDAGTRSDKRCGNYRELSYYCNTYKKQKADCI